MILLSLVVLSPLNLTALPEIESFSQLGGLAVKELLVGVLIGLVFRLLFFGVYTAGSMVSYQIGFAIVTVFDTNLSNQVAIIGRFWYFLAMLVFLAIDGHHLVITAFADSYGVIPPGAVPMKGAIGTMLIKYSAYVFVIALKIASPIMISLFLTDVALGVIAKTMPTMNVFFVGFPIKITVGLAVMAISLPVFAFIMQKTAWFLDEQMQLLLMAMGEA